MVKYFLASVACMGLVAACAMGGAQQSRQTAAPVAADSGGASTMPGDDPRAEIEKLSAEIDQKRTELGLAEPQMSSSASTPAEPMSTTPLSTDATCKPAKTDRCSQSCTFSDSICTNAARICKIAATLTADTWAAGKCSSSKQTCDSAHESCCSCQ